MMWRCVRPVGRLHNNDRINKISCKEVRKVHRIVTFNKAKLEFVEQQKVGICEWQCNVGYIC